jgi:hypothetical protein
MPSSLGNHLNFYFSEQENRIGRTLEFQIHEILKDISPFLRFELMLFIYKEAINSVPFL